MTKITNLACSGPIGLKSQRWGFLPEITHTKSQLPRLNGSKVINMCIYSLSLKTNTVYDLVNFLLLYNIRWSSNTRLKKHNAPCVTFLAPWDTFLAPCDTFLKNAWQFKIALFIKLFWLCCSDIPNRVADKKTDIQLSLKFLTKYLTLSGPIWHFPGTIWHLPETFLTPSDTILTPSYPIMTGCDTFLTLIDTFQAPSDTIWHLPETITQL